MSIQEVDKLISISKKDDSPNGVRLNTMNEILYHTRSVRNGANDLPIVADMPINSYETKSTALINAKKIIEAGADGVKVEGGKEIKDIVRHLKKEEIFMCGHIGLTPQTKTISEFKFKLDDLLDGINDSYGKLLLDELIMRLELTVKDFNAEIKVLLDQIISGNSNEFFLKIPLINESLLNVNMKVRLDLKV